MKVPLEILIYIFTLATRNRGSAASWMLYQRRSKPWFEKQLYEKVLLCDEYEASLFLQCLRRRQTCEEFATSSIKAMSLSGDINVALIMAILSLCKGINNLSLRPHFDMIDNEVPPLIQLLDTLPLKVLSLQIGVPFTSSFTSNVTLFAKITHLEVDDPHMLRDISMASFPQLTHLSLWGSSIKPGLNIPLLVTNILSHITLEVVIFRIENHKQFADFLDRHELNDPRIVLATPRRYLWDDLGRSCMLFWELAEEKAKLREPNHNNHRCFTRSALTNGVRDFMDIDRVPEDHPDYEIVLTNVIGANGRVRASDHETDDDQTDVEAEEE
ncbi:hypothetical protein BDR06DRAFT_977849 [Suillus hirtellus]|nr:hypothetical protein BDR06DRAFT_977849 [Suillus hirtellus]